MSYCPDFDQRLESVSNQSFELNSVLNSEQKSEQSSCSECGSKF